MKRIFLKLTIIVAKQTKTKHAPDRLNHWILFVVFYLKWKKETNDCVKFEHKLKFIKIVDIFVNNLFVFCCPLKFKISQLESLEMSPFLSFYWHANQNMAQVVWMSEAMKLEQKKEYRQNCQFQEFFFFLTWKSSNRANKKKTEN